MSIDTKGKKKKIKEDMPVSENVGTKKEVPLLANHKKRKLSTGAMLAILAYIIILVLVIIWLGYDLNTCQF